MDKDRRRSLWAPYLQVVFVGLMLVGVGYLCFRMLQQYWSQPPSQVENHRVMLGNTMQHAVHRTVDAAIGSHQSSRLDLNSTDIESLCDLPGIGEVIGNRILAFRRRHGRYEHVHELLNVKGIGPKTYMHLKTKVAVIGQEGGDCPWSDSASMLLASQEP